MRVCLPTILLELSKAPAESDRTKAPGRSSTTFTVTIAGDHASRTLVTDQLVLNVTGTYTVRDSLFGAGSPLTPTGGGTFNVGLWQLGLQSVMGSAKARIGVLQPAGRGQIGSAARVECAEGILDGRMVLYTGTWAIQGAFRHEGFELPIQNGGELSAQEVLPSRFFGSQQIEGKGSRLRVAGRWQHGPGGITLRDSGALTCREAVVNARLNISSGGTCDVAENLLNNGNIRIPDGGGADCRLVVSRGPAGV